MAPKTVRGCYMGAFGMTWGTGYGLGLTLSGAIMDNTELAKSKVAGEFVSE